MSGVTAGTRPDSPWCMRWRQRQHSWRHRSEGGFDARRYDVAALSEADAKAFVAANHYSGSYPAARLRYGLYDGPWLVGVAVLAVPMQRRVLTTVFPDLEPYEESLDLARFCLGESVAANGGSARSCITCNIRRRQEVGSGSENDPGDPVLLTSR